MQIHFWNKSHACLRSEWAGIGLQMKLQWLIWHAFFWYAKCLCGIKRSFKYCLWFDSLKIWFSGLVLYFGTSPLFTCLYTCISVFLVFRTPWKRCCFSGDGEYIVAGSARQHALYIWEKSIGNLVKILHGTRGELLLDVAVSALNTVHED